MAIGAQCVLVEPDYTDRSFLEDFAAYYVRCFENYRHVCTRLHFFGHMLTRDEICAAIVSDNAELLQKGYRGFIVVKPLPLTVIGRTCLAVVPPDESARYYPTVRQQPVDLYGLRLSVETLPFQEQDREVAACASSALWTMFHSTSRLFQHAMPSPVEITTAATLHARVNGRTFPNGDGLNTIQIADAIRSVGLEPFVMTVSSLPRRIEPLEEYAAAAAPTPTRTPEQMAEDSKMQLVLKLSVLAYLRTGLACVLLGRTCDQKNAKVLPRGNHAVAITGYSLGGATPKGYGTSRTRFVAERLDRLFVHDDQTGPFATLDFDAANQLTARDFASSDVERRFVDPINLCVPLYHKIRIPLQQVVDVTVALDEFLEQVRRRLGISQRFEWDIELIALDALRDEFSVSPLSNEVKLDLLTMPMPRFVWRVRALYRSKPGFDLLLDATDLLQGNLVRHIVAYQEWMCRRIGLFFNLSGVVAPDSLEPTIKTFRKLYAEGAPV